MKKVNLPIFTTSTTSTTSKLHQQKHTYTNYKKFTEETEAAFKYAKISDKPHTQHSPTLFCKHTNTILLHIK